MQSEQTRRTIQDLNQIDNKNKTYRGDILHCNLLCAESHASEESFETIAPSISATSAGSTEADDTMTHTSLSQQQEDKQGSIPLEATSGETEDAESDVRSLPSDYIRNEEKHAVPSNVSLNSNGSHDSSFHSVLYDHWHTADEFEADYATDFTEEDSTDSFGPVGPKSKIGLGFEHLNEQEDECSVDAVYSEHSQGHRQEGLHKTLTMNNSLHPQKKVTPKRRRIALDPQSPVPKYIHNKSRQARAVIKKKKEQAKAKYEKYLDYRLRRKAMRKAAKEQRKSLIIVIPSNHRLKIMWDVATIALTFVSAYVGHIYIRDRSTYEWDWFVLFTNVWFFVDLLLNFFTEHRTADGTVMKTGREVWGRYLTTWFAIDALSLLPWERMFLRPIIQKQKSRNFVVKWFFRSKAVVKVTRILKGRHVKAFGKLAHNSKRVGIGGKRLLQLSIKYVPKYVLFYRNMKGVIFLKTLRQIHFAKKIFRGLNSKDDDEDVDDEDSLGSIGLSEFFLDDDSETGDYSDDQGEIGDDFEYRYGSMSRSTSVDTDYESCVGDEDGEFFIHFTNIPHVQRTAYIEPTCDDNNE